MYPGACECIGVLFIDQYISIALGSSLRKRNLTYIAFRNTEDVSIGRQYYEIVDVDNESFQQYPTGQEELFQTRQNDALGETQMNIGKHTGADRVTGKATQRRKPSAS